MPYAASRGMEVIMDLIHALKNIGFTQQEAIIYTTLCKQGSLTGYEAAKLSGISRSNAYAALSSLVEKGGAHMIQGASVKYTPIEKQELLINAQRAFLHTLDYIDAHLPQQTPLDEPYITLTGHKNIVDKMKNMILHGQKRIYISAGGEEISLVSTELQDAIHRNLKVVLITPDSPALSGTITYFQEKQQGQIKMIIDTSEVLTGHLEQTENTQCLYSKNKTLVSLIRETFMNEIALIKIQNKKIIQEKGVVGMNYVYAPTTKEQNFYGNTNPVALTEKYGSPLYVYNESILRERCREMKNLISYPHFSVNFSAKANSSLGILQIAREEGLNVDAMSPGEMFIELEAGFEPEQIFYISNNVSAEEMQFAIDHNITISVDSLSQLELFGKINPGGSVAIRFNPGVGAGHHEKVITAGKKTKFGVDPTFVPQVKEILEKYNLRLVGINQHIGSLFMDGEPYVKGIQSVLSIAKQFDDLEFVDLGGGFGIPYHKQDGQTRLDLTSLGEKLDEVFAAWVLEYGKEVTFKIEPGRYIVAECGVLLGTVHAVKTNYTTKYAGTDVGFNVLKRPVMYDSHHDIEVYRKFDLPSAQTEPITVVGNICESGDILAKDRMLPEIHEGDILGIMDAGAYGHVMSSNYNNRLRPAEVLIRENGEAVLIRKRDTLEQIMQNYLPID